MTSKGIYQWSMILRLSMMITTKNTGSMRWPRLPRNTGQGFPREGGGGGGRGGGGEEEGGGGEGKPAERHLHERGIKSPCIKNVKLVH